MAEFKLDFNQAYEGGNSKIEDGTYEVVIEKANEDATPSGAEYINFWLRIRNDIKQASQNQMIFHRVWKGKQTGKYNAAMINTLAKSAQLQNGKSYGSLNDLLNDFVNKPLKATVKNETSDYNGKTYENLNVKYTNASEYPDVQHRNADKSSAPTKNNDSIDIQDEDLPF